MEYVYELPGEMLDKNVPHGEVKRFEYDTQTYDEGGSHPLHKGAWVYLPHGYSEEARYNVLYLLHGGGVNEDWWFRTFPDTVLILDNMIEKKICDPCIIVTPTYYRGGEADRDMDRDAEYITEQLEMKEEGCLLTETVDEEHGNPLKVWHGLEEPANLTEQERKILRSAARPFVEARRVGPEDGKVGASFPVRENAVVYFEWKPGKIVSDRGYSYGWAVQ